MVNLANSTFLEQLYALPHFAAEHEINLLVEQHGVSVALVQEIVSHHYVNKDEVCRLWADSLGCAYVDPFSSVITDEAVAKIPVEIAKKALTIGLYLIDGVLTAAMATPDDLELVKGLAQMAQVPISPVFALPRDIIDSIVIQYSSDKSLESTLADLERSGSLGDRGQATAKITQLATSDSLVQFVQEIIHFALRENASDIHIEPQENLGRIRFRVDGQLREILTYSRKLHGAMITRLKTLASLNQAEGRFPQEGRFSLPLGSVNTNFRLCTIPSSHGEKAVVGMVATAGRRGMHTLEKMMISQTVLQPFKRMIESPSGLIFVTGPAGSGKTTTLYAALHEINKPDLNISTIEDPIEVHLEGVTQTQVNSFIDLKVPAVLRSLLRQDPDVIMIGEIRDGETAKIAAEAALSGQLVFATLHTNTAAHALLRLMELGVAPYLVAPSVIGVLGQRLVARICENCRESYHPPREVLSRHFELDGLVDVSFYRGRGCPTCRGTGYKDRIAFHEFIPVTEEIRTLISEGRNIQEITRAAAKVGFKPLRYDGLKKVLLGLTTIEEIEHNTSFEWVC